MTVMCPHCKTAYRLKKDVSPSPGIRVKCARCGNSFALETAIVADLPAPVTPVTPAAAADTPAAPADPPPPQAFRAPDNGSGAGIGGQCILIAHDDGRVVSIMQRILEPTGLAIITADRGSSALDIITSRHPRIAVIDVALPEIFGFELCERIKNTPELQSTKVVLVASIYDRTRYKRRPQNLYGADDYLEKHHIPDDLLPKVLNLLEGHAVHPLVAAAKPVDVTKQHLLDNRHLLDDHARAAGDRTRDEIRECETTRIENQPPGREKARTLARIIASDIALYNDEIINQVNAGNFRERLGQDFQEGIQYLSRKFPEVADDASSLLDEAFVNLLHQYRGARP